MYVTAPQRYSIRMLPILFLILQFFILSIQVFKINYFLFLTISRIFKVLKKSVEDERSARIRTTVPLSSIVTGYCFVTLTSIVHHA
jgi:hypothetical protein